jgi:NADH-quinone oxidoreductase subunit G
VSDTAKTDSPTEGDAPEVDAPPPDPNAVSITINGKAVTARKGEYVIAAADRAGEYIPRFCYHPRMSSVGMCRQCLVEIDSGRGPQLQPSCMVTVAPDMKVETESPAAKRAQEGIIEMLLANHPLDCPVCDKGGECPLQDQAFSHGPGESRYVEEKRHYEKPIPISDLVLLDRERCILCDRCTRFADEVAGDALIHFTQRGNETQVMTFPDEPFSSYFSGNTVQICPVGALTATPYRFKARPWDLAESESTCMGCSVGCRITVQSSRDELVRYLGVDSDPVNWGWLCDKGRFGFETINSDERLTTPLVRTESGLTETTWSGALAAVASTLAAADPKRVAILGGARGTNEDAFAWARLADSIGIANRDAQLGDGMPAALLDLPRATIDETTAAPTIILLGPDPKEELGVLYLRLRHTAEKRTSRIIELTPTATGLSRNAWRSIRVEPGAAATAVAALRADDVAGQLAKGPVVIVAGRANLAESAASASATLRAVYEAVAAVQPDVKVLPALRRGNVHGALQLGLRPANGSLDALGILAAAQAGEVDVLVLLGADPLSDCPDPVLARNAVEKAGVVIALDGFLNDSSSLADVVLPAALFAEKSGTTTNLEGRVTTVSQRVTPAGTARADWMVAAELADRLGHDDLAVMLSSVESITSAIAGTVPAYAAASPAALDGNRDGVLAVGTGTPADITALENFPVGARNSYDYRLVVARTLYDQAVATSHAPSLAPLAGAASARVNPADADKLGVSGGGRAKVSGPRGEVVLDVVGDAAVPRGTVFVPFNHGSTVNTLVDAQSDVTDLRIEALQ